MPEIDLDSLFDAELDAHAAVLRATRAQLKPAFGQLVEAAHQAVAGGGKLLFFGNGGSAADAQHIATELTVRYVADRAPIAAIALNTDSSTLTAAPNDYGFDQLFARQVSALARPGDLAVGLSTSGTSANVLEGLRAARAAGAAAAGLSGRDGGRMGELCRPLLVVPSDVTARIQEMHITLGHLLCAALERRLGLVDPPGATEPGE